MDSDVDEDTNQVQSELVGHHLATIHVQEGCRLQYHRHCSLAATATKLNPLIIHWFENEMVNVKSQFYILKELKSFVNTREKVFGTELIPISVNWVHGMIGLW